MKGTTRIRTTLATALFVIAAGHLTAASGANLELSNVPLFVGGSQEPNIVFTLDDSGSMQFEIMPGDTFLTEVQFLFPRLSGAPYGGATYQNLVPNFFDNNLHNFYSRSAANNILFYNPDINYVPWSNSDGSLMDAADPRQVKYNPTLSTAGTIDLLAQQTTPLASGGTPGVIWYGSKGTALNRGYCWGPHPENYVDSDRIEFNSTGFITDLPNSDCYSQHTYWPITYYNHNGTGSKTARSSYTRVRITDQASTSTPSTETITSPGGITRTRAQEIQNFANWFQYYRSRILTSRAGIGRAFSEQGAGMRVGFAAINQGSKSIDGVTSPGAMIRGVRPFSGSDRDQFFTDLYGHPIPAAGTPLRRALDDVGKYFERRDKGPWDNIPGSSGSDDLECRQSYNVLMTDGYWNGAAAPTADARKNVDNTDGNLIANPDGGDYRYRRARPYRDDHSNTLADVGMYYWNRDLRPDVPNRVPTNPADPAFWQHLVNFTIGLGVNGTLNPATDLAKLTSGTLSWPEPGVDRGKVNIDDLWHTALNSRGDFFSVTNPDVFANVLGNTLAAIKDRAGSAAAVALNSGSIIDNTRLYQARFDSGDWSGQLLAIPIDQDGNPDTIVWDAGAVIDAQSWDSGRRIVTMKPSTGAGIPFRWSGLDPDTQQDALNINPASTTVPPARDSRGQERLEYVRGKVVTGFRTRSSALGDIVHSAPVYVGAPAYSYPDSLEDERYSDFRANNRERDPMIYVGANDGMLHALDAGNGEERFAYVPSPVFKNLSQLTAQNYNHRFYVDGSPTAVDAYVNGAWGTILAGGLRGGGQGIYALDITNPSDSANESAVAEKVMWEFTGANDPDLGYTFGEVSIVRMHNGKWAAVFGNGYNNTEIDGSASTTGNAVLYIVDLESGELIKKIDTFAGMEDDSKGLNRPNGLAAPAPVDIDGDYIVDFIYAGDLFGNMWKFDVRDSSSSNWGIPFGTTSTPEPLFVAKSSNGTRQPITSRPQIGKHPTGEPDTAGILVYFGTGQYIETGDNTPVGQVTQTFYSIWDKPEFTAFIRSALLQQQIIKETAIDDFEFRVTSDNPINWQTHRGWYMDLFNTEGGNTSNFGERQVTNSVLRGGRIIFTTLVPNATQSACDPEGNGWLMEMDAASGARLPYSPFFVVKDGEIISVDYVTIKDENGNDINVPVSGKKSTVGIIPTPGIVQSEGGTPEYKYTSGSTGEIETTLEDPGPGDTGRQTWRQLR